MSKNKFQKRIDTVSANTHKRIDEQEKKVNNKLRDMEKLIPAYFITTIGICGAILTFYIDQLRTQPIEREWMQITGFAIFSSIFLLGAWWVSYIHWRNR